MEYGASALANIIVHATLVLDVKSAQLTVYSSFHCHACLTVLGIEFTHIDEHMANLAKRYVTDSLPVHNWNMPCLEDL